MGEATDDASLVGRVVAVTGASSGIGLAVAELARERGARVALLARRGDVLRGIADRLGPDVLAIPTDVTDPGAVRAALARVDERWGRVDVLVNGAGAMRYRMVEENTDDDVAAVVGTCLLGAIHTVRAAVPLIRRGGGGDIVNIGSEVTELYLPGAAVYAAAKAGLARFSADLGRELRPAGIRVTEVVVGYTATGLSALVPPEDRRRMAPLVRASAYRTFSGTEPMEARWVAETALFPVTRPRGQYVGVIHARSTR